ncbi:hypothetical protein BH10CYA1_BH10CYA1_55360 [soil metagenome]
MLAVLGSSRSSFCIRPIYRIIKTESRSRFFDFAYCGWQPFETKLIHPSNGINNHRATSAHFHPNSKPRKQPMNEHVKNFNKRLIGIFEVKAEEFTKHSQENPLTSGITAELAGLYADLVEVMKK